LQEDYPAEIKTSFRNAQSRESLGTRALDHRGVRAGKTADVVTLGAKGEVLKVTKVNLDGFGPAMDTCIAIWAKKK
jgi:hypothetical protein